MKPPQTIIPEVLPPDPSPPSSKTPPDEDLPKWLNRRKLALAFLIAAASDLLSIGFQFIMPVQIGLDLLTAFLLFMVLGWRWPLLVGLVMEAIPGVAIFPAWVLVVSAMAALGQPRPNLR